MAEEELAVTPRPSLNYRHLRRFWVGAAYWLILTASAVLAVFFGAMIVFNVLIPAMMPFLMAGGLLGLLLALQGFAAAVALTGMMIMIGCLIVPTGATLAGFLNTWFSVRYAKAYFKLSPPSEHDDLGQRVIALSARLDMPPPSITKIEDEVVNAFAMGFSGASGQISIGAPLIRELSSDELDAIIGHELGHLATGDTARSIFGQSFQGWLTWFFLFYRLQKFVRWIMTPLSEILLMMNSRHREYWADAIGAFLTSKEAMIGALEKIHSINAPLTKAERRNAHLMFRGSVGGMFRTHPTLEQRVTALRNETYLRKLTASILHPKSEIPETGSAYGEGI